MHAFSKMIDAWRCFWQSYCLPSVDNSEKTVRRSRVQDFDKGRAVSRVAEGIWGMFSCIASASV